MILFSDLVDGAGIEKNIARLAAASEKFADSAYKQNARVGESVADLKAQIVGLKSELANLGGAGSAKSFAGIKEGVDAAAKALRQQQAVIDRNNQLLDLNAASVTALRNRLKDLESEYNNLDRSQAGSQARMRAIASEIKNTSTVYRQLVAATNEAKRSVDLAEGSYARLDRQTKQLRADLQNMPGAFDAVTGKVNQHNRAAVEMLARIQANDKALKTASASMGQHQAQVGSYGLALKSMAGQLIGVTSVVGAIQLAASAVKAFVDTASDMERINNTLKAVSRDTVDFGQKQSFLLGLSHDLGYEYSTLADSYAKISASTKDTAVEGKKAQDVYRGFVVAGAGLHLSNEKIERSLNAVQQMFDKTTVGSEELKTQLADAMPGAVKIFADALGISTRELNKQMAAGNLLAVDVLPKVAAQLEKTYGEAAKRNTEQYIGTIAGVKTEFGQLVDTLNQDAAVTGFFAKINRGISNTLRDIKLLVKDGDWKDFVVAFSPLTMFSNGRAQRRANDDTRQDFGKADTAGRVKIMQDLLAAEQFQREQGERALADKTLELRRELMKKNGVLLRAEAADQERQLTIAKRNAIDRNEQDLARFEKQSAIKRAKELNEIEAQIKKDPTNEVLQHKLDVYDRLDQQATAKDRAAKDRIRSQRGDSASKVLSTALSNSKASADTKLSGLSNNQQDGLISERDFIEARKKITLDGITERQIILSKAGQRESDDYKNLVSNKLDAELQYKRDLLKLNLSDAKAATATELQQAETDKNEGLITEREYVERKHDITVDGLKARLAILKAAGQGESKAAKDINTDLINADGDYYKERLKIAKQGWAKELQAAKDGLSEIDKESQDRLVKELERINAYHNKQRVSIKTDVASGKISSDKGEQMLHLVDMRQLQAEETALRFTYDNDRAASKKLIDDKIAELNRYKAEGIKNPKEIAAADEEIRKLQLAAAKDLADDKIALDKKVSDKAIESSDKEADHKIKNLEKEKQAREKLSQLIQEFVETSVNAVFNIERAANDNRLAELDKQKDKEIEAAGDNANAKKQIEAKYDAETRALRRQQAIRDREQAVFSITINSAVALVKTLAEGGPLAIPIAFAIGALALTQIANVVAAPLPAYKDGKNVGGSMDNYTGPALVGEAGRELWLHSGKAELVDKPSILNVGRTDRILPNYMTEQLLSNDQTFEASSIVNRSQSGQRATDQLAIGRETQQARMFSRALVNSGASASAIGKAVSVSMAKEIAKLPFNHVTFDARGVAEYVQQANSRRTIQDKKHQFGK